MRHTNEVPCIGAFLRGPNTFFSFGTAGGQPASPPLMFDVEGDQTLVQTNKQTHAYWEMLCRSTTVGWIEALVDNGPNTHRLWELKKSIQATNSVLVVTA